MAEARRDIRLQARLILLDKEEVVAPLRDDLLAEVALAEDGVAGDDAALDRQDAQQFQGGLVLVGLGIDFDLHEDGFDQRGVGGDQVLAGHRAVAATAQGLAIQGDGLLVLLAVTWGGGRRAGRDPACQRGLKGDGVEAAEEPG